MDKPVVGNKTAHWQRPRVDRFVLSRDSFGEMRRRRSWHEGCDHETIDIWHSKKRQQKNYISYLDQALGLEPLDYQERRRMEKKRNVQPWPCAPRKKTFLSAAAISILDLPTYGFAAFPELIDWSSRDFLVAALGRGYYLYSWREQLVVVTGNSQYQIQCCRFDPRGELLLIGEDMNMAELHDSTWGLVTGESICHCSSLCSITAVDWSPTGNSYAAGCSRGCVTVFDRSGWHTISKWFITGTRGPVQALRVSPDARFLAVAVVNSPLVRVLVWPSLKYHSSMNSKYEYTVKTITWHPWRSALLAIGALNTNLQSTIVLWDIPSSKMQEITLSTNYPIDLMLFSHRTGELVLSLWDPESASVPHPKTVSQLVVLSDPHTVVDQSGERKSGLDRVRTMVFNPDGSKIATGTVDEDLIIWNFLPEEKNRKKLNPRKFYRFPAIIDALNPGLVLR